jgi:sigma-B regulation protein RsbU (phosphoserine phosphatase)
MRYEIPLEIGVDHAYLCVREGGRQRLCVAVGDVSGHGIPSAITMATARAFLRLRASLPGALGEMVSDVNRKFVEDAEATAQAIVLAVLDAVEEFRGPGEPEDDITLMAVKVTD